MIPQHMSEDHTWETPEDLFALYDNQWCFGLDAAASAANTKCARWYGPQGERGDALDPALLWPIDVPIWLNPPYKRGVQRRFVQKAADTALRGGTVVVLLPVRSDTKVWHSLVWDKVQARPHSWVRVVDFLEGRVRFVGGVASAPFPSCVVTFTRKAVGQ